MTVGAEDDDMSAALHAELVRRDISQADAAEIIGVTQQSFSRWISGENGVGSEHIPAVARFLRLSTAQVRALNRRQRRPSMEARVSAIEDEIDELRKAVTRLLALLPGQEH